MTNSLAGEQPCRWKRGGGTEQRCLTSAVIVLRNSVMISPKWLLLTVIAATTPSVWPAEAIDAKTYHLRSGTAPEWQEFAGKTPDGKRLDVRFNATRNANEA